MIWLFWGAVAMIAYVYAGFAAWLWFCARIRRRPVRAHRYQPFISIVIVVRNEARVIETKLLNLLHLNYPAELIEIVAVSDGSTDDTNRIVSRYVVDGRVQLITTSESCGKAAALNAAIANTRGELVMFTDARQRIEADALRFLADDFGDPEVGCSSGELMLGDPQSGESSTRIGLYWRIEKKIREWESTSGSVVGVTGALYAVRRKLLPLLPTGTILDDVFIPMSVVRQGYRVVFNPHARAWDIADQGVDREFSRKVRTLSGNYQLIQLAPWLLGPANPIRFRFVSHKLLRLIVPFALIAALLSAALLPGTIYRIAFVGQLLLYALGLIAMTPLARGPLARVADVAYTFVVLNSAAAVAFANFVTGRKVVWGG